MADFVGAFAVVERDGLFLMAGNDRRIAGRLVRTWDLPGGRVEAGEMLHEALARELREETGLSVRGEPRFLFVQEGERTLAGRRQHVWRSCFFAVDVGPGEPAPANEVQAVRWMSPAQLRDELTAPYHDSFLHWLERGGSYFRGGWHE